MIPNPVRLNDMTLLREEIAHNGKSKLCPSVTVEVNDHACDQQLLFPQHTEVSIFRASSSWLSFLFFFFF